MCAEVSIASGDLFHGAEVGVSGVSMSELRARLEHQLFSGSLVPSLIKLVVSAGFPR